MRSPGPALLRTLLGVLLTWSLVLGPAATMREPTRPEVTRTEVTQPVLGGVGPAEVVGPGVIHREFTT